MGTNYYVAENKCDCCNRYDKPYHIGKASWGWAFSFRGYKYDRLASWRDWKTYLADKLIVDEYGQFIEYAEFVAYIEKEKSPNFIDEKGRKNLVHNSEGKSKNWYNPEYDWDDEEGYSFTSREFS